MGIKFYDSNGKYWGEYDEARNLFIPFKKRTMRDCYNCKRYETEGECIECHYEPKDEPHIVGKHADVIIIDEPWYKEEPKDEPQTYKPTCNGECRNCDYRAKDGNYCMKTDCSWK